MISIAYSAGLFGIDFAFSSGRRGTTVGFPKAKTELSGFGRLWWMRCDLW